MSIQLELIERLANGDPLAFKDIFNLYYPRLMSYCKLFIKDNFEAEDLVQECFVQLWNKRKILNPERNVGSLLFIMLRNHCINFLRDYRMNDFIEFQEKQINTVQYVYHIDFIGEDEKSLEEQLSISLNEEINKLPKRQKEVFIKTKIENRNQKEVAAELGVTVKAIEKNIAVAKKRIREELLRKYPTLFLLFLFFFK
jgi:RNA polymerase sigma-70 factor (ECF subfamily)